MAAGSRSRVDIKTSYQMCLPERRAFFLALGLSMAFSSFQAASAAVAAKLATEQRAHPARATSDDPGEQNCSL